MLGYQAVTLVPNGRGGVCLSHTSVPSAHDRRPTIPPTVEDLTAVRWTDLTRYINQKFHQADMEALECALSATVAHYKAQADPVWLFVVGPSSTAKTGVVVNSVMALPEAKLMSDLSSKALLSGFGGSENASLLKRLGNSAIMVFKDFTTMISLDPKQRAAVVAQLREIYDGEWTRQVGLDKDLHWEGKITVIAAVTPSIEREWSLLRDLGERFVTVRWERGDSLGAGMVALDQRGQEKEIVRRMKELTAMFVQHKSLPALPTLPKAMRPAVVNMAEMVAVGRARVVRDSHGGRDIIEAPHPEASPRVAKALGLLVQAHACLFRRECGPDDLRIARRVALDSIPHNRLHIIRHIPEGAPIGHTELLRLTEMPRTSLKWHMDELAALHIVKVVNDIEDLYEFTEDFANVRRTALTV